MPDIKETEVAENTRPLHPEVIAVQNFISEVLTQEEHVARVMSILGVLPHEAVLAAADRIKQYISNAPEEDTKE